MIACLLACLFPSVQDVASCLLISTLGIGATLCSVEQRLPDLSPLLLIKTNGIQITVQASILIIDVAFNGRDHVLCSAGPLIRQAYLMNLYQHLRPARHELSVSEEVVVLDGRSRNPQYHQYQSTYKPYNMLVG